MPNDLPLASPNPLELPAATSLDELFSRSPFDYGKEGLAIIVAELRRMRKNFLIEEAKPKATRAKALKSAPIGKEKLQELDLDDLGI